MNAKRIVDSVVFWMSGKPARRSKRTTAYVKELSIKAKSYAFDAPADAGEIIANLMLSYRHLEDAAMRLGKVIQAHDGGKSVYDK